MKLSRQEIADLFGGQAKDWTATANRLQDLAAEILPEDARAAGLLEQAVLTARRHSRDWAVLAGKLITQPEPEPEPAPPAEPGPPAPSRVEIPAWRNPDLRAGQGGR